METVNRYKESLKQKVVKGVLEGKFNVSEACRKYGIKSADTITRWIQNYKKTTTCTMKKGASKSVEVLSFKELQLENQRLKKENEMAQLSIRSLNLMIDFAEDAFKIPIRKKPGAK